MPTHNGGGLVKVNYVILGTVSLPVALVIIAALAYSFGNADLGRLFLTWGLVIGSMQLVAVAVVAYLRR